MGFKEIGAGFVECRGYSTVSVQNRQSSFSLFLPSSSCIIVGHVAFEPPSFFFLVSFSKNGKKIPSENMKYNRPFSTTRPFFLSSIFETVKKCYTPTHIRSAISGGKEKVENLLTYSVAFSFFFSFISKSKVTLVSAPLFTKNVGFGVRLTLTG